MQFSLNFVTNSEKKHQICRYAALPADRTVRLKCSLTLCVVLRMFTQKNNSELYSVVHKSVKLNNVHCW